MERLEVPKNFDLLVVDVEGKESEIFQTFELNEWKPKMIIVELEDEHPTFQKYPDFVERVQQLRSYILDEGYTEIYKNQWNTVFVSHD